MQVTQRFSASPIWKLQKQYYLNLGMDSWSKALVPFSATSNAFIAQSYAQVIRAFLLDYQAQRIDSDQPVESVNIVELGVGHGRFSFMLIKALDGLLADIPALERPRFHYIMTDVAEANVKVWQNHQQLQPYLQRQCLDFAVFDADEPQHCRLIQQNIALDEFLKHKPIVVVANFMLDVLAYDLFKAENGKLWDCLVDHHLPDGLSLEDEPAKVIEGLQFQTRLQESNPPCYSDPEIDQVLQTYRKQLRQTVFQFPVTAMKVFAYFSQLSSDMLWLMSEEGDSRCEQLEGNQRIGLKNAGSFTSRVNLHALFEYATQKGSECFMPALADARFDSYVLLAAGDASGWRNTRQSIRQSLLHFGPKDYFRLLVGLYKNAQELSPDTCISLLELGHADPYLVYKLRKALDVACQEARNYKRAALERLLCLSWENYYDLGEDQDFALLLARLSFKLKNPALAENFLLQASQRRPENVEHHYWRGQCAEAQNLKQQAIDCYQRALSLNKSHRASKERLRELLR